MADNIDVANHIWSEYWTYKYADSKYLYGLINSGGQFKVSGSLGNLIVETAVKNNISVPTVTREILDIDILAPIYLRWNNIDLNDQEASQTKSDYEKYSKLFLKDVPKLLAGIKEKNSGIYADKLDTIYLGFRADIAKGTQEHTKYCYDFITKLYNTASTGTTPEDYEFTFKHNDYQMVIKTTGFSVTTYPVSGSSYEIYGTASLASTIYTSNYIVGILKSIHTVDTLQELQTYINSDTSDNPYVSIGVNGPNKLRYAPVVEGQTLRKETVYKGLIYKLDTVKKLKEAEHQEVYAHVYPAVNEICDSYSFICSGYFPTTIFAYDFHTEEGGGLVPVGTSAFADFKNKAPDIEFVRIKDNIVTSIRVNRLSQYVRVKDTATKITKDSRVPLGSWFFPIDASIPIATKNKVAFNTQIQKIVTQVAYNSYTEYSTLDRFLLVLSNPIVQVILFIVTSGTSSLNKVLLKLVVLKVVSAVIASFVSDPLLRAILESAAAFAIFGFSESEGLQKYLENANVFLTSYAGATAEQVQSALEQLQADFKTLGDKYDEEMDILAAYKDNLLEHKIKDSLSVLDSQLRHTIATNQLKPREELRLNKLYPREKLRFASHLSYNTLTKRKT
jgi:hypothetical protein